MLTVYQYKSFDDPDYIVVSDISGEELDDEIYEFEGKHCSFEELLSLTGEKLTKKEAEEYKIDEDLIIELFLEKQRLEAEDYEIIEEEN